MVGCMEFVHEKLWCMVRCVKGLRRKIRLD